MRLIDADKLENILSGLEEEYKAEISQDGRTEDPFSDGILSAMFTVFGEIKKAPAVDAVPVVHAHWDCIENVISYEGTFDAYECSHCHKMFLDDMCQNNGSDYVDAKKDFKYCPFCGARMDEEEER